MNTNRKGAEVERKARKLLEAEGWSVTRSGGSLGLWDLVAIPPHSETEHFDVLVVQVRANRRPRPDEYAALHAWCRRHWRAAAEVWVWKDRAPRPERETVGRA